MSWKFWPKFGKKFVKNTTRNVEQYTLTELSPRDTTGTSSQFGVLMFHGSTFLSFGYPRSVRRAETQENKGTV